MTSTGACPLYTLHSSTLLLCEVSPPLFAWVPEAAAPLLPSWNNHQDPLPRPLLFLLPTSVIVHVACYRLHEPPCFRCCSRCQSCPRCRSQSRSLIAMQWLRDPHSFKLGLISRLAPFDTTNPKSNSMIPAAVLVLPISVLCSSLSTPARCSGGRASGAAAATGASAYAPCPRRTLLLREASPPLARAWLPQVTPPPLPP